MKRKDFLKRLGFIGLGTALAQGKALSIPAEKKADPKQDKKLPRFANASGMSSFNVSG